MKMTKKSSKAALGATGVGAGVGAVLGSGLGIAGAFGAISGVLPLAALGGYIGFKAYKALTGANSPADSGPVIKPNTGFQDGFRQGFSEKSAELKAKRLANQEKTTPKS